MSQIVNLTINGQKVQALQGQTVLEAATAVGIKIPTLCHHPALTPIGACRVCLVEISRLQPLQPACTYPVTEGLTVETHSPRVETARRFVLELLFSERNHYCMFCEMSGQCELQDLGYLYGLDHWTYPTYTQRFEVDASRETFLMDQNRCILCRRCIRACAELVANHTLGLRQRGAATMISADMNVPFGESSCIECGTCLQVCPTGALVDKRSAYMDMGHHVRLERVKSTCSQCSVGCGIEVVVRGGSVLRIEGDWGAPVNGGLLCQKGRFAPLYDARQRLTAPLVRKGGVLQSVSWEEALETAVLHLSSMAAGKMHVLVSTSTSNEALYLVRKLFRQGLGVDRTGLLNASVAPLPVPHKGLAQIEQSDLILVAGADPAANQPVVSFLVKRTADRGARLLVVDGPENGLIPFAHDRFEPSDMARAVELAARADSPAVLYGAGLTGDAASELCRLEKASFVALQPGCNTRGAVSQGLAAGADGSGAEALFVLLGEEEWGGQSGGLKLPTTAFLVVQAAYRSDLSDRADVVLPSAIWSERTATLTNLEGRVLEARQAVAPAGQAKPDWEILSMLARQFRRWPSFELAELTALAKVGA